jgi:hypothetical protein
MLELVGGQRIFVSNRALRRAAPEVTARLVRGEAVDPAHVYYRCVPSLAIFKVLRAASGSWTDRRRNFHPPAINPALTAATDISIYVPRLVEKNGRNPPEST